MAVHAQHPFNSTSMQNNLWDDNRAQFQQPLGPIPLDCYNNPAYGGIFNGGTVFSEPESELTCNISRNRKRSRDFDVMETPFKLQHPQGHEAARSVPVPTSRMKDQELGSDLSSQSLTLEDIIRYENQKLCVMVDELRKKHSMSLLGMIEQMTTKKLQEKETELLKLMKVNMELEEKVKRVSMENQMWLNVAKNSEATVCSLRLSLEQILQQNANGNQILQGAGEANGLADDAHSTCNEDGRTTVKRQMGCKLCGACDASCLVLPCRHLCLCEGCETKVFTCPVCNTKKSGSLQVFLS